jgi:hypothetical protein
MNDICDRRLAVVEERYKKLLDFVKYTAQLHMSEYEILHSHNGIEIVKARMLLKDIGEIE